MTETNTVHLLTQQLTTSKLHVQIWLICCRGEPDELIAELSYTISLDTVINYLHLLWN